MNLVRTLITAATAAALAAACDASAETLYKMIDKNGKVTYSEKPPKDFDGKVIRLDIDPNANTATLPKATANPENRGETGPGRPSESAFKRSTTVDDRIDEARANLERARKAFEEARDNPGPGDIDLIGKKGGGARPQPTEAYQSRLEKLELAVKEAEDALQKAEQAR